MSVGRIFGDQFWGLLESLEKLKEPCVVEELGNCEDVRQAVELLQKLGLPLRLERWADQQERVIPVAKPHQLNISISVCDWLALQAHFQAFDRYRDKAIDKRLQQLLQGLHHQHPILSLFAASQEVPVQSQIHLQDESLDHLASDLRRAIGSKQAIDVSLHVGDAIEMLPLKLYEMENGSCLVGQQVGLNTMHFIALREIKSVEVSATKKVGPATFAPSMLQIDEFINALCAVSGERIRLILKILAPEKINFAQGHGALQNPYMTNTNEGHLIWAATVNINTELLNWLFEHREILTIVDPNDFREIFEDFCRQKELIISKSA